MDKAHYFVELEGFLTALTAEEKDWLNRYHERIEQTLSKELAPNVQEWLKQACAKI